MQGPRRKVVYVTLYELFAIAISSTGLAAGSGASLERAGVIAVASAVIAIVWNLVYNTLFERWESRQLPALHLRLQLGVRQGVRPARVGAAAARNPMSAEAVITRHLRITGRVQGVGYRWNMTQQAQALGISGWVRNRRDGSVEALACGVAKAVQVLVEWARRGPEMARVDAVEVREALGPAESLTGFEQRETV